MLKSVPASAFPAVKMYEHASSAGFYFGTYCFNDIYKPVVGKKDLKSSARGLQEITQEIIKKIKKI